MELIKCAECIWGNNCPCGWSYCNAACLTIQQQLKDTIRMKISKNTCDKEFAEKKLELSESKCKECEYFYICPYILRSYNDVVYGD